MILTVVVIIQATVGINKYSFIDYWASFVDNNHELAKKHISG